MQAQNGQFIPEPLPVGSNINEGCFFAEQGSIPVSDELAITEVVFTCPVKWAATYRANKGVETWRYSYEGSYYSGLS